MNVVNVVVNSWSKMTWSRGARCASSPATMPAMPPNKMETTKTERSDGEAWKAIGVPTWAPGGLRS